MLKPILALALALVVVLASQFHAQSPENVTFKVTVVDDSLNLRNVPKFPLVIRKTGGTDSSETRISTSPNGSASISLPPGKYLVTAEKPLTFQSRNFVWEQAFT